MNALIPAPDTLPMGAIWFQGLLLLTLPIHLLFMNAMLGTGVFALYGQLRGGKTHRELAHELAQLLPPSLLLP